MEFQNRCEIAVTTKALKGFYAFFRRCESWTKDETSNAVSSVCNVLELLQKLRFYHDAMQVLPRPVARSLLMPFRLRNVTGCPGRLQADGAPEIVFGANVSSYSAEV